MVKAALSIALLLVFAWVCAARVPLHLAPVDKVIKDSYLVVLHDSVTQEALEQHINKYSASQGFKVQGTWTVLNGYHVIISQPSVLHVLLDDENVKWVEEDQVMSINYNKVDDDDKVITQSNLPTGLWGLSRVWQRTRASTTTYQYWESAGSGVDVYIVDTGLNAAHVEFTGRVVEGFNAVVGDTRWPGTDDGNGHGTHVASTTAGTTYGVAKKATIIPVKVLSSSGSGSTAGVINGTNWVLTNFHARKRPSTANMSLGGGASATLDQAVTNAVAGGVTFVVAAGNDNANACNYSPARTPTAITVGSSTNTDARSSFSNFGTCVDIFAPGSSILGAWYGSATATSTISGTSMASPHVCGAAALYLGRSLTSTPAEVTAALVARATANAITSPGTGSPNRLLFTSTTE